MRSRSSILDFDLLLLGAALALMMIGVLFIYSSGLSSTGILMSREYIKQIIWVSLGMVILIVMTFINFQKLRDWSPYIYLALSILLIYTRIFGRVVNGSKSWIGVGEFGIQPSEFMKIATILFLGKFLSDSERSVNPFRRFILSACIVLLPIVLILALPDFGTALVYFPIFFFMAYIGGIDRKYILFTLASILLTVILTVVPLWGKYALKRPIPFLSIFTETRLTVFSIIIISFVLILSIIGYRMFKKRYYFQIAFGTLILDFSICASLLSHIVLKDYQVMRLIVFLDPSVDPKGSGWNIIQSITAIGSGGFWGKGFLQGTQSHYRFLPQQSTDFIFSILSEEWGFAGALLVFSLFLIILVRGLLIIKTTNDTYGALVSAGVTGMIFFHFFINVGMAMGIMPITGIPLFFLSYGGSSLCTALSGIGVMMSVYLRRYS
jgi:rod shape determining protein RodA